MNMTLPRVVIRQLIAEINGIALGSTK